MKTRQGQILLITVMLLATVMTIVLSISFKSVTETQVTKLEEESQKALAAAESAIEAALKANTSITLSSISGLSGFDGTATLTTSTDVKFTTPNIEANGSYTFYLGNYNVSSKTMSDLPAQDYTICFENGSPDEPALEITLVKDSGVKKYVVDPNSPKKISNAPVNTPACNPDSTNYSYSIHIPSADVGADAKFLIIRVLYSPTRLFFTGGNNLLTPTILLPVQGRTITSQATSNTSLGVSKKVVLFQSYPQIPGEF